MPEQGGGKGFGRLPFNYRGQRARLGERPCCTIQRCPASVSVLDTRSGPGGRTPAGLLHMYYMRLCSEKLLADIRGLCSPFSPSSSANLRSDNVPPLSSENSTRVTLHLARVHRLAALVSRADDIVYPPFFLFSFRPPFVPPSYSTASPSRSSIPLLDSSPPRIAPVSQPKGEEAGQPSILRRVIVRPLSTQARQIRLGMGFLTIGTASNEGRFPLKLGKRWKRGSTLRLTFQ